jgi:hypothetical protein
MVQCAKAGEDGKLSTKYSMWVVNNDTVIVKIMY